MQTSPLGYTLGCQMGVMNFILGGRSGYASEKNILQLKIPPSLPEERRGEHLLRSAKRESGWERTRLCQEGP